MVTKGPTPQVLTSSAASFAYKVCAYIVCLPENLALCSGLLDALFRAQAPLLTWRSCLEKEICLRDDGRPALATALQVSKSRQRG